MNPRIKDTFGWIGIASILLIAMAAFSAANSYSHSIQPSSFRSFTVSGTGKVAAVPDVAEFSFSVITEGGKDLGSLQGDNTTKINKIIDYIKSKGIAKEDIETTTYNVEPRYQYSNCPSVIGSSKVVCNPPSIVGYTITQSVTVKARKDNFDKVGELVSGVVTAGANNVSQLSFTIDDRSQVEAKAKADAIAKAKKAAETVAKAGGFRIGKLLSIEENSVSPVPYFKLESANVAGDSAMAQNAPTIEPGSQEVTVMLTLRYEIK